SHSLAACRADPDVGRDQVWRWSAASSVRLDCWMHPAIETYAFGAACGADLFRHHEIEVSLHAKAAAYLQWKRVPAEVKSSIWKTRWTTWIASCARSKTRAIINSQLTNSARWSLAAATRYVET